MRLASYIKSDVRSISRSLDGLRLNNPHMTVSRNHTNKLNGITKSYNKPWSTKETAMLCFKKWQHVCTPCM